MADHTDCGHLRPCRDQTLRGNIRFHAENLAPWWRFRIFGVRGIWDGHRRLTAQSLWAVPARLSPRPEPRLPERRTCGHRADDGIDAGACGVASAAGLSVRPPMDTRQRVGEPGAGEALSAAMEPSGMCSHDGRFRASYMTS
ncbi:hypothetical protein GCM10023191_045700 [Actinoallomurus oryzae]|uniref:Uncharacterized protein n=1 Tax=Actinoallomurus oryzae TaxID=502180 RepID=A0ABP8QA64_9ACTN